MSRPGVPEETLLAALTFGTEFFEDWIGPVQAKVLDFFDGTGKHVTDWRDDVALYLDRDNKVGLHGSYSNGGWDLENLRLNLERPEVRHRLCVILAAGIPCPGCQSHEEPGYLDVGGGSTELRAGAAGACLQCNLNHDGKTPGWLRVPAPAWHLLPEKEGGTLTPHYYDYAPELLVRHAQRVSAGLGGIRGVETVPRMPNTRMNCGQFAGATLYWTATSEDALYFTPGESLHPGWLWLGHSGPETGEDALRKVAHLALNEGWALEVGIRILLPGDVL